VSAENSKGVAYRPHLKKWIVRITVDGQRKQIGSFATEAEAAEFYAKAKGEIAANKAREKIGRPKGINQPKAGGVGLIGEGSFGKWWLEYAGGDGTAHPMFEAVLSVSNRENLSIRYLSELAMLNTDTTTEAKLMADLNLLRALGLENRVGELDALIWAKDGPGFREAVQDLQGFTEGSETIWAAYDAECARIAAESASAFENTPRSFGPLGTMTVAEARVHAGERGMALGNMLDSLPRPVVKKALDPEEIKPRRLLTPYEKALGVTRYYKRQNWVEVGGEFVPWRLTHILGEERTEVFRQEAKAKGCPISDLPEFKALTDEAMRLGCTIREIVDAEDFV